MPSQYPISTANVQSVPHIYILFPICNEAQSVKPNVLIVTHKSTAHVQLLPHLYWPCSLSTQYLQQKSWQNPISAAPLMSMSCQHNISPAHVQSVHQIFCPCPVRIPHFAHYPSESHSISSQNTSSHTLVLSEYHIFCHCPVGTLPLLRKFS